MADSKNYPQPTPQAAGVISVTIGNPPAPPPAPTVPAGNLNASGTHDNATTGTLTLVLVKTGGGGPPTVTKTPNGTTWSHTFSGLTPGDYVLTVSLSVGGDSGTASRSFTVIPGSD